MKFVVRSSDWLELIFVCVDIAKPRNQQNTSAACLVLFDKQDHPHSTIYLAADLSTTTNQLSLTSVLIQQNWPGDIKQFDMARFAEALPQGDEVGTKTFLLSLDF